MDYQEGRNQGPNEGGQNRRGILEMGKSQIAHQVADISQAVRDTGERLGGGQDSAAGRIAGRMAEALQKAGDYLDSAEPQRLIRDAKDTARRQPEVFLGTAFIGGLLLGRLLRSQSASSSDYGAQHRVDPEAQRNAPLDLQGSAPGTPAAPIANQEPPYGQPQE